MSNIDRSERSEKNEQKRSTSSTRRSRSVSRNSESNADRGFQEQKIKDNTVQTQKIHFSKDQNKRGNKNNSNIKGKTMFKRKKPAKESYWDEDGFLLDTHQNDAPPKKVKKDDSLSNKSYLTPHSIAILVNSRPSLNRSIMETAEQSPRTMKTMEPQRSQKKRAPSVQEARANFNKFIERQRESAEKRISSENNINESNQEGRFLSKESRLILKRSNKQNSSIMADSQRRKKREYQPDEFTYHPDLSLTLHSKNVTGLSVQFSEAKAVIKDIQLTAIKVEQEAIDMKECTYKPDLISNPKIRAKANREKMNQIKKQKNSELVNAHKHKDEDEDKCKQVKFYKGIPSRTQELNDMLKVFRSAGREKNDDDEKF